MRPVPTLLAFLAIIAACTAETPTAGVSVRSDVPYLAPERAERLDLYFPPGWTPQSRGPALLWIHGGGWAGGKKTDAREKAVCSALASQGYVCASIDYVLGKDSWPQNLHDSKNGVRYLRSHAAELGIDPDRIVVGGGSAGGHLALMVGLTSGKPGLEPELPYPGVSSSVRAVLDLYGITNLRTWQKTDKDGNPNGQRHVGNTPAVFGAADISAEVYSTASPVNHVGPESPPVLILQGRADTTVDYLQSVELDRVLGRHAVPHALVLLEGVGHTFDLAKWGKKDLPRSLLPEVMDFLGRHNGPR